MFWKKTPQEPAQAKPEETPLVKFLAVGRLVKDGKGNYIEREHQLIATHLASKTDHQQNTYMQAAQQLMAKGASRLVADQRMKMTTEHKQYELHVLPVATPGQTDQTLIFFVFADAELEKYHSVGKLLNAFQDGFYEAATQNAINLSTAKAYGACQKVAQAPMGNVVTQFGARVVTKEKPMSTRAKSSPMDASRALDTLSVTSTGSTATTTTVGAPSPRPSSPTPQRISPPASPSSHVPKTVTLAPKANTLTAGMIAAAGGAQSRPAKITISPPAGASASSSSGASSQPSSPVPSPALDKAKSAGGAFGAMSPPPRTLSPNGQRPDRANTSASAATTASAPPTSTPNAASSSKPSTPNSSPPPSARNASPFPSPLLSPTSLSAASSPAPSPALPPHHPLATIDPSTPPLSAGTAAAAAAGGSPQAQARHKSMASMSVIDGATEKKKKREIPDGWVIGKTIDIETKYELGPQLGSPGTFGAVRIGIHKEKRDKRAVKVITKGEHIQTAKDAKMFRHEIKFLRKCSHPNIVKLLDIFENEQYFYIVMELCEGGELFDRMSDQTYSEKDAQVVMLQIVSAVRYMHAEVKIAHLDIKPTNIMYLSKDVKSPLKFIDFGLSKKIPKLNLGAVRRYFKSKVGSPFYVAPEILQGKYNHSADLWSIGVLMHVMLTGYPPFFSDTPPEIGSEAAATMYEDVRNLSISEPAKDLLTGLLELDPVKRPTASEVVLHPWMVSGTLSRVPVAPMVRQALRQWNGMSKFKNAVLQMLVAGNDLNEDQTLENVRKAFQDLDKEGTGEVLVSDLFNALKVPEEVRRSTIGLLMRPVHRQGKADDDDDDNDMPDDAKKSDGGGNGGGDAPQSPRPTAAGDLEHGTFGHAPAPGVRPSSPRAPAASVTGSPEKPALTSKQPAALAAAQLTAASRVPKHTVTDTRKVKYADILMAFTQRKLMAKEERLWAAFKQLDVNNKGYITAKELQTIAGLDSAAALAAVAEADKDGDGRIYYPDFLAKFTEQEHETNQPRITMV